MQDTDAVEDASLIRIRERIERLRLEPALLSLNHLLATSRGETADHALSDYLARREYGVVPYIVHFLAKEIACFASPLGPSNLSIHEYFELQELAISLADPILFDPEWKNADPTGFLIRIFAQQFPAQHRLPLQKYGLGLGLFRDAGLLTFPTRYDLRAETEAIVGVSVPDFMALAQVVASLRGASHEGHPCSGTFQPMLLARAFEQGIPVCVPEVWAPFLERVACDLNRFRDIAARPPFSCDRPHSIQFELNPLRRFPILNVGDQKYIAVDPDLLIDRVTFGLFHDLFEIGGVRFSECFGYAFDAFVGQLLTAVSQNGQLWAEVDSRQEVGDRWRPPSQNADRAYQGRDCTVLIECKSLRPSLNLTVGGDAIAIQDVARRVASAVRQLTRHSESIGRGQWTTLGLPPNRCVGVVVTFGTIYTANGPFFRQRVRQILAEEGIEPMPYVVLSLAEFDAALSLVTEARPVDQVMAQLTADENSFHPLTRFYENELRVNAISPYCKELGLQFLRELTPGRCD